MGVGDEKGAVSANHCRGKWTSKRQQLRWYQKKRLVGGGEGEDFSKVLKSNLGKGRSVPQAPKALVAFTAGVNLRRSHKSQRLHPRK